ncbi:MAG: urease accessory protein UreD [Gammaproteobacteria bacterium]|nr:MAG: urease accessory protein UreD [Gammaproteobacteria bacterium]
MSITEPLPSAAGTPADMDDAPGHWAARLEVRAGVRRGRTALLESRHRGPLRVQKPFHPGDGRCHVYVLHPPGGVAPGDRLHIEARIEAQARVLFTTPAANKFYRSDGRTARLRQRLSVADGAVLEWLPQEAIVFDGARAETETVLHLAAGARMIAWEWLCLGRYAAGERFRSGRFVQRCVVYHDDRLLLDERFCAEGGAPFLDAFWGLNGAPVLGTLLAYGWPETLLDVWREGLAGEAENAAVTCIDGLVVCRYLGRDIERARAAFTALWSIARRLEDGPTPIEPRIWST